MTKPRNGPAGTYPARRLPRRRPQRFDKGAHVSRPVEETSRPVSGEVAVQLSAREVCRPHRDGIATCATRDRRQVRIRELRRSGRSHRRTQRRDRGRVDLGLVVRVLAVGSDLAAAFVPKGAAGPARDTGEVLCLQQLPVRRTAWVRVSSAVGLLGAEASAGSRGRSGHVTKPTRGAIATAARRAEVPTDGLMVHSRRISGLLLVSLVRSEGKKRESDGRTWDEPSHRTYVVVPHCRARPALR